jgi:hypothetical protein
MVLTANIATVVDTATASNANWNREKFGVWAFCELPVTT